MRAGDEQVMFGADRIGGVEPKVDRGEKLVDSFHLAPHSDRTGALAKTGQSASCVFQTDEPTELILNQRTGEAFNQPRCGSKPGLPSTAPLGRSALLRSVQAEAVR